MKPWKGCSGTMFIFSSALADIALSRCPQNSQLGPTNAHCLRLSHCWSCSWTPPCFWCTGSLSSFLHSFGWLLIKSFWPELCWYYLGKLSELLLWFICVDMIIYHIEGNPSAFKFWGHTSFLHRLISLQPTLYWVDIKFKMGYIMWTEAIICDYIELTSSCPC